ncbi:MAG: hypothetical protein ACO35Q_04040 [Prochlorothrix sp.]
MVDFSTPQPASDSGPDPEAALGPEALDSATLDPEALDSASNPDLEPDQEAATQPRSGRSPGESLRRRWWRRKFMPALLRSLGRGLENWADRLEDRVVQVTTTLPGELRRDWGARVLRWRLAVGVRLGAVLGGWWGVVVAIGVGVGLLVWGGPGAGWGNWGNDSGADLRADLRADRVETKAVETEAVETEAVETEAVETKAVETKAVETKAVETKAIKEVTIVSADPAFGADPETAPDASQPRSSLSPVPESGFESGAGSQSGFGLESGSGAGAGLDFSGAIADRAADRSQQSPADRTLARSEQSPNRAPTRELWPLDILEIDLNPPSANPGLDSGLESGLETGLDFSLEAGWGDAPVLAWQEEDPQEADQQEQNQPEADQNNSPVSGQISENLNSAEANGLDPIARDNREVQPSLDPPLGPPLPPDPIATLTAHLTADLTQWLQTHPDFPQPPTPASSWLTAITPDLEHQRLRVVIAPGWDALTAEQQEQWVAQLQTQATALQVQRWELWEGDRHLLARSPVVGQSPLVFRRSAR